MISNIFSITAHCYLLSCKQNTQLIDIIETIFVVSDDEVDCIIKHMKNMDAVDGGIT